MDTKNNMNEYRHFAEQRKLETKRNEVLFHLYKVQEQAKLL